MLEGNWHARLSAIIVGVVKTSRIVCSSNRLGTYMKRLYDESVDKYWLLMNVDEAMAKISQNKDAYEELFNITDKCLTKYKKHLFWGEYEGDWVLFLYVRIKSRKWFKLDLSYPHGKWLLYLKMWKNEIFSSESVPKKIRNAIENSGFSINIVEKGVLLGEYDNPSSAVESIKKILEKV